MGTRLNFLLRKKIRKKNLRIKGTKCRKWEQAARANNHHQPQEGENRQQMQTTRNVRHTCLLISHPG